VPCRWRRAGRTAVGTLVQRGGHYVDWVDIVLLTGHRIRILQLATAVCVVVGDHSSSVLGANFLRLGDLTGGGYSSGANGISADGCAAVGVGTSAGGSEAFRWTLRDGMIGLGDLPGGTVNSGAWNASADGSVIVGMSASASGAQAFRWTQQTGMVGLGDLPGGSSFSVAHGVSADGNVVVGYGHSTQGQEAFRWTPQTGMVSLGDFSGGEQYSAAAGISADGRVIVGLGSSASGIEAFRWTAQGGMVSIGGLPGGETLSGANSISGDASMVVGVDYSNLPGEAFVWSADRGLDALGFLPGAGSIDTSQAYDVSVLGHVVVGTASTPTEGNVAVVWDEAHGLRRLDQILAAQGVNITGWRLTDATGISDDGQVIVGRGYNPSGFAEAWMAIVNPLANPANPGDVNSDGRVNQADLAVLMSNLGAECGMGFYQGDMDADRAVTIYDVMQWRQHFGKTYPASSAAAVPEPASTTLVFVGLLAAAVFAQRRRNRR
jgi:probable HAF family extracellular repeat protein